mgnify:CR=1 FL=1
MKWIVVGVAVPAGLIVLVVGIGALLPVAHTATVERDVAGTPEEVWAVMTDVESFPAWRPGVESVERVEDAEGRVAWRETSRTGALTMAITEHEPPHRMVTTIIDDDLPFGGTWTYVLEPREAGDRGSAEGSPAGPSDGAGPGPPAGGTRITITEDGEVYNPFFRFVSRFVLGYDGMMKSYLDGIEARMAAGEDGR